MRYLGRPSGDIDETLSERAAHLTSSSASPTPSGRQGAALLPLTGQQPSSWLVAWLIRATRIGLRGQIGAAETPPFP